MREDDGLFRSIREPLPLGMLTGAKVAKSAAA
jgi:hypothetical protein